MLRPISHRARSCATDILSIIGLLLALCAILVGAMLKGAGLMALVSTAGFTVVVLGTIGAICVQTPLPVMRHALKILPWIMRPPALQPEMLLKKMLDWSNTVRRQGLLALEPAMRRERDPFVRKALQLVVDGNEPDAIRGAMEVELSTREHTDTLGARVFEGMGVYAPTLGIIGAVLGLMSVLQNLSDPSKTRPWHCRRLYGDGVRHRPRQPVFLAHRREAESDNSRAVAGSRNDH